MCIRDSVKIASRMVSYLAGFWVSPAVVTPAALRRAMWGQAEPLIEGLARCLGSCGLLPWLTSAACYACQQTNETCLLFTWVRAGNVNNKSVFQKPAKENGLDWRLMLFTESADHVTCYKSIRQRRFGSSCAAVGADLQTDDEKHGRVGVGG